MKKKIIFLSVILLALFMGVFVFKRTEKRPEKVEYSVPEVQVYENLRKEPIEWVDAETTEQLEQLFKGTEYDNIPRIFVRRFPDDFSSKGNPVLFAEVLLPYLLRENELLQAERAAFLAIADKIKNAQQLTQKEKDFWDKLVLKYEVLNPDMSGQQEILFMRLDRISPSMAIAQGLEATQNARSDLDAPFDVRRWNNRKEYDFVRYSDLALAVSDYALELNRGQSYLKFHMLRAAQRPSRTPLKGKIFARGLKYYKLEDVAYIQKLDEIFKYYKFEKLDESQFRKEK